MRVGTKQYHYKTYGAYGVFKLHDRYTEDSFPLDD